MKVRELMTVEVASCRGGEPMARAAELMWEHDCGCVPVVDGDERVLGLVTDRDLTMAAWTQGVGLAQIPVERSMSSSVQSCRADEALEAVLARMAQARVRRLPVCDEHGRLVGMLSLADVLQGLEKLGPRARRPLGEAVLSALGALTRPRRERNAILLPATPAAGSAPLGARARAGSGTGATSGSTAARGSSTAPATRAKSARGGAKRSSGSGRSGSKR